VVALHLAAILFIVLGGVLAWRWPRVAFVHLPFALWGTLVEWAGWVCPLTPLENRLRALAGQADYQETFVQHWILPIVYPEALTRDTQGLLGALVVVINVFIYSYVRIRLRKDHSAQNNM